MFLRNSELKVRTDVDSNDLNEWKVETYRDSMGLARRKQ